MVSVDPLSPPPVCWLDNAAVLAAARVHTLGIAGSHAKGRREMVEERESKRESGLL